MGMYDDLIVHSKHLPEEIKKYQKGWQTKSHECYLNLLEITESGELYVTDTWANPNKKEKDNLTGEIEFYQDIMDIWYCFIALFKEGKLIHITQIEPID
jgi:hypothetical protein